MAVTIGPIQDFISSARRTRDFWYGSWVLSEISKTVARSLSSGAELIFPAPADPQVDLEPGSRLCVANVVVGYAYAGHQPQALVEAARSAAQGCWIDAARSGLDEFEELRGTGLVVRERWESQVRDVVEFYAAWVRYEEGADDYQTKRKHLMRLLGGRKTCRDFSPAPGSNFGIPKSSLDGARETVFAADLNREELPADLHRRLRLSSGEQLDAIGLTKRLGGERRFYPSVARLAAEPWARGAQEKCPAKLRDVKDACKDLVPFGLIRANWTQFEAFPYEGQAAYRFRLPEMAKELRCEGEQIDLLSLCLKELCDQIGEASPYLVVLAADGDRMGRAISELKDRSHHRIFSAALSQFAGRANEVVIGHHGCLVYAGGDDVLAFLPLDTALECACQLHSQFHDILVAGCGELMEEIPTLSVGLSIGHFLDPLEDHLKWAREAEKAAKGGEARDGLAIHYHPRSGAPVMVEGRWKQGIADRLEELTLLHRDGIISDKSAYDLRELSRLYENWPEGPEVSGLIQADVVRLLNRKRGAQALRKVHEQDDLMKSVANSQDIRRLAEEMIIGRIFAGSRLTSGWNPRRASVPSMEPVV